MSASLGWEQRSRPVSGARPTASLKRGSPRTTFDFLGFTHVWGRSRRGKDIVRQITAKGSFARALKSVHDWCKKHRHLPIEAQRDHLANLTYSSEAEFIG